MMMRQVLLAPIACGNGTISEVTPSTPILERSLVLLGERKMMSSQPLVSALVFMKMEDRQLLHSL